MIVVVGSLNIDWVLHVPSLPVAGQTLSATGFEEISGGKGANQAVGIARLGGEVTMIGCVGDDEAGRMLRQAVTSDGVLDAIATGEQPTGAAFICVATEGEQAGDNQIVIRPGANHALTPQSLAPHADLIRQADVLVMQLEVPLATVEEAARIARQSPDGPVIVLDPAPAVPLPDTLLDAVDVLTPNQTEAAIVIGSDEPAAIQAFCERHHCYVALTRGGDGVEFFRDGTEPLSGAALPVTPVDTTAAGDAFTAGLAVAIADDYDVDEMLTLALAAGSLATTRHGAQPSLPTRGAIDTALNALANP